MPESRGSRLAGDRILRSTAVLPWDASSVEVTAFHGFDAFGRLWRGSANGVSVLAGGFWRHLSTEDGLIWNDTDGEAFWADADGSVWIGTSGGLAHYRPPGGGLVETADGRSGHYQTGGRPEGASSQGRVFLAQLQKRATDAVRLPLGPGALDRHYGADHLLCRPGSGDGIAWRSGLGFGMDRFRQKWPWRSFRLSQSGGKPGGRACRPGLALVRLGGVILWKGRMIVRRRTAELESSASGCWKRRGVPTRRSRPKAASWQT